MTGRGDTHSGRAFVWQKSALEFRPRSYALQKQQKGDLKTIQTQPTSGAECDDLFLNCENISNF
jgi:hypothetical protein